MLYEYNCPEHGPYEVIEDMDDEHCVSECPICGKESSRVFTVPSLSGDLPTLRNGVTT
jgi:putative FmdB family regulatory protein